jgi:hypothetical protein
MNWNRPAALTRRAAEAAEPVRRTYQWWRSRRQNVRLNRLLAYRQYADDQFDVLFHFPDMPVNLYQARQWYGPLEKLAEQRSVAILCYQPETAEIIRAETSLPVVLIRGLMHAEYVRQVHRPKVILYPNQNYTNFGILGLTDCQHAFICHGESDKIYMASNWMKVFNYDLVAGPAAKERLRQHLIGYDIDDRTIEIGRPQIDVSYQQPTSPSSDRTTVLYAPTWEGGRSSMAYGSVASHGPALVSALLSDDRWQVIHRPHPRTGSSLPEHDRANKQIKQLIQQANRADPDAGHMIDDSPFGWQLSGCDVMVTDISAVAYDWLSTAKPLIVTRPVEDSAVIDPNSFISDLELLPAEHASDIGEAIEDAMTNPQQADQMQRWSAYHYGDTSAGASMSRFLAAIEYMIIEQQAWQAGSASQTRGTNDPQQPATGSRDSELQPARGRSRSAASLDKASTTPEHRAGALLRHRYRRVRESLNRYRRLQRTLRTADELLPVSQNSAADPWTVSHFLVNYPGSPSSIASLLRWLPTLHRLHQHASVSILVGDVTVYEAVQAASNLPCYFGRNANDAELIAKQLHTKVMLYVNQAKLNLREGGLHDAVHVFLGSPGTSGANWLNNRLRLFDYVLAPDNESKDWLASQLMHYDADAHVRVVPQADSGPLPTQWASSVESPESEELLPVSEPAGATDGIRADEPLDSDQPSDPDPSAQLLKPGETNNPSRSETETGIDAEATVAELLQIRTKRDELIEARDKELAERGIVLVNDGQV